MIYLLKFIELLIYIYAFLEDKFLGQFIDYFY